MNKPLEKLSAGLSSIGDSFLLGNLSERKILHELVFGQLEDVRSCLDKESLTLTLLHLIGSGRHVVDSYTDNCTFLEREVESQVVQLSDNVMYFRHDKKHG